MPEPIPTGPDPEEANNKESNANPDQLSDETEINDQDLVRVLYEKIIAKGKKKIGRKYRSRTYLDPDTGNMVVIDSGYEQAKQYERINPEGVYKLATMDILDMSTHTDDVLDPNYLLTSNIELRFIQKEGKLLVESWHTIIDPLNIDEGSIKDDISAKADERSLGLLDVSREQIKIFIEVIDRLKPYPGIK